MSRKGGKERSPAERDAQRAEIARLYLQGSYQSQIAKVLGCSQQQISVDLRAIRKQWRESAIINFDARQAEELAKIDLLESTYWNAWQRSCEAANRTKQYLSQSRVPTLATPSRVEIETIERVGDPRYLEGVERCIQARCKLLGLNAPEKLAPTDPTGMKPYDGPLSQLSVDELQALRRTMENPSPQRD